MRTLRKGSGRGAVGEWAAGRTGRPRGEPPQTRRAAPMGRVAGLGESRAAGTVRACVRARACVQARLPGIYLVCAKAHVPDLVRCTLMVREQRVGRYR